jgi:hypothetical protein
MRYELQALYGIPTGQKAMQNMSMIENLATIKQYGMDGFLRRFPASSDYPQIT